eukprot:gnl/Chilomastix_cuspidata/257.p1 GENE.gnl/Chilomastix_cuspidata/257~~gnl/Chilomastix_cuspidata/257.p1  ORF type:complete len:519 (+),score=140.08 gnl/Chilomastix_cuspidata/257:1062-2618(+)
MDRSVNYFKGRPPCPNFLGREALPPITTRATCDADASSSTLALPPPSAPSSSQRQLVFSNPPCLSHSNVSPRAGPPELSSPLHFRRKNTPGFLAVSERKVKSDSLYPVALAPLSLDPEPTHRSSCPALCAPLAALKAQMLSICKQQGLLVLFKERRFGARAKLEVHVSNLPPLIVSVAHGHTVTFNMSGSVCSCSDTAPDVRRTFEALLAEARGRMNCARGAPLDLENSDALILAPLTVNAPARQMRNSESFLTELRKESRKLKCVVREHVGDFGHIVRFREESRFSGENLAALRLTAKVSSGSCAAFAFSILITRGAYTLCTRRGRRSFSHQDYGLFERELCSIVGQCMDDSMPEEILSHRVLKHDFLFGENSREEEESDRSSDASSSPSFCLSSSAPAPDSFSLRSYPISPIVTAPASDDAASARRLVTSTIETAAAENGVALEVACRAQDTAVRLSVHPPHSWPPLFEVVMSDTLFTIVQGSSEIFCSVDLAEFVRALRANIVRIVEESKRGSRA